MREWGLGMFTFAFHEAQMVTPLYCTFNISDLLSYLIIWDGYRKCHYPILTDNEL